MKLVKVVFLILFLSGKAVSAQTIPVKIGGSEAYELSNIILAITPYGKDDPWEVYKKSDYYKAVIAHFDKHSEHPLIAKVNYSRQEWDKFLSFRTDAYAFDFDEDGKLRRREPFATQEGLNLFEENLELVNDFASVSGFREFYRNHKSYYDSLAVAYQQSQMLPEMLTFLEAEFGGSWTNANYAVVMSPLVYRMNCHRNVNGVATDFITLPEYILNQVSQKDVSDEAFASGLHMLFTEMDHGFVNPATFEHKTLVRKYFDSKKWDKGSGYNELDEFATFNEYMTWGVYDLFIAKYFPKVAQQVNQNWAMQNESRGFFASAVFNAKLKELYDNRKEGQTIRDLYPALLKWSKKYQVQLTQPTILSCPLHNGEMVTSTRAQYTITFTERMQQLDTVDIVQVAEKQPAVRNRIVLTKEANNLSWSDGGRVLSFELDLENGFTNHIGFNIPWTTKIALKSRKGVHLKPYASVITTKVQVPQQ